MPTTTDTPRIYVASLSDYNAGILHGVWIDCDQDADAIREAIEDMLADSPQAKRYGVPSEEYAIHDSEGWHGYSVKEHDSPDDLAALAEAIEEHGDAIPKLMDWQGLNVEDAVRYHEENYNGRHDSEEDFAEYMAEELGDMKSDNWLLSYIDWGRLARDMFISDYHSEDAEDGGVHVWRNN